MEEHFSLLHLRTKLYRNESISSSIFFIVSMISPSNVLKVWFTAHVQSVDTSDAQMANNLMRINWLTSDAVLYHDEGDSDSLT